MAPGRADPLGPAGADAGRRPGLPGVSSHAPHPNAARLFQNWITSEAGLAAFQARYGSAPLLAGSEDLRDVRKEPWYKPITKVYEPDYDRWAAQYDKDMGFWINLIRAQ